MPTVEELQQMVLDRDIHIVELLGRLTEMTARFETLCEALDAIPLETPKNILEVMGHDA